MHYELSHDPHYAQLLASHHASLGALGKAESVSSLAALLKEMKWADSSYWQFRDVVRMSS